MSKELKRFEKWWDAEDDIPNNGPYTPDTPIQFAWAGWQAALAEQPAPVPPGRNHYEDGDVFERIAAMKKQPAQQEPVANAQFMRQVLSVAIAGLYEHYKDDVLRVFTLDDLRTVIDLSESLQPQQVEDIYKRAWVMLNAAQQEPVPGVVIREGLPTLLRDCGIKPTDARLYTSPPAQRTWVGLTDEDMVKLQKDLFDAKGESVLPTTFAMAVEAKLRSKNT